jgi:parvulin-like peptidyl-prolyl isomerase
MNVLAQAQIGSEFNKLLIPPEEVKAHYEKNKANYEQARVKAIYVPFGTAAPQAAPDAPKPLSEAEAKAKAVDLVKQARAGADFVKLVKEHSKDPNSVAKDGDFGLVARGASIPDHIKTAIFAAKPGEITDPVRQPNGFYIFRIEERTTAPLEQVQASITEELKNARFGQWIQAQQSSVKIEERTSSAAPAQPPQPPAAK